MAFYLMPSGKLPMQGGSPVLITQSEFEECCCGEEPGLCGCCGDETPQVPIEVTFAGVTGPDAANFNDTFVLSSYSSCQWGYAFPSPPCSNRTQPTILVVRLAAGAGGGIDLLVYFIFSGSGSGCSLATFGKNETCFHCDNLNESLSLVENSGCSCADFSAATCTVANG